VSAQDLSTGQHARALPCLCSAPGSSDFPAGGPPGDIVLDDFSGVGSTIMAPERVGRICYSIEIDPLYVDTTVRRWEKRTGKRAVHAESSKHFETMEVSNV
jgi:hypothetical protein